MFARFTRRLVKLDLFIDKEYYFFITKPIVICALNADLEWKLTYVGNANNKEDDQVLEELCVGPVAQGVHMFVFQAPAPASERIANDDLIGVTVILLTCSYLDQIFVQIGYYVNNEYSVPFEPENLPNPVDISLLSRNILADQPRVTPFAIDWTGQAPVTNLTSDGE